jgi:DNA-binding response OmpR family regulator
VLKNQLDDKSMHQEKWMYWTPKSFIVSCDEDVKGMLKYAFDSYGIQTCFCQGREEVLALSEIDPFDCIIIDFDTPGMDGIKLIRQLREQFLLAIIIGLGTEDRGAAYLQAGANDFLQKPFVPYRLAMMLDSRDIDF